MFMAYHFFDYYGNKFDHRNEVIDLLKRTDPFLQLDKYVLNSNTSFPIPTQKPDILRLVLLAESANKIRNKKTTA